MYGIVHGAMRELVVREDGREAWAAVVDRAGQHEPVHLAHEHYADEVTLALVGALADHWSLSVEQTLLRVGRSWPAHAIAHGYGSLLASPGDHPFDVLTRLDDLHTRLALAFPNYRPPSFSVKSRDDDAIDIAYATDRTGLVPFLVGIIEGLGAHLDQPVSVSLRSASNATPVLLHVELTPP